MRGPPAFKTQTQADQYPHANSAVAVSREVPRPGLVLFRRYVTGQTGQNPTISKPPCRFRVEPHNPFGNRTDTIIRRATPPRAPKTSRRPPTSYGPGKSCVCRFSTTSSSRATSTAITRCSSEGRSRASMNEGRLVRRSSESAAHHPPSIMSGRVIETAAHAAKIRHDVRARTTFTSVTRSGTPSRSSTAVACARPFRGSAQACRWIGPPDDVAWPPPSLRFSSTGRQMLGSVSVGRTTPFARTAPTQGG